MHSGLNKNAIDPKSAISAESAGAEHLTGVL